MSEKNDTYLLRTYYPTGEIFEEIEYKTGFPNIRHGIYRLWHKDGLLAMELLYKEGIIIKQNR